MHLHQGYEEQGRITHAYLLFGRWRICRMRHCSGARLEHLLPRTTSHGNRHTPLVALPAG